MSEQKICPMCEDGDCALRSLVKHGVTKDGNPVVWGEKFKDVECKPSNCPVTFIIRWANLFQMRKTG